MHSKGSQDRGFAPKCGLLTVAVGAGLAEVTARAILTVITLAVVGKISIVAICERQLRTVVEPRGRRAGELCGAHRHALILLVEPGKYCGRQTHLLLQVPGFW